MRTEDGAQGQLALRARPVRRSQPVFSNRIVEKAKSMKSLSRPLMTKGLAALGILALVITCQLTPFGVNALGAPKTNAPPKLKIDEAPIDRDPKVITSLAPVVKKVAPSVVNIYSTTIVRERATANPF